MPLKLPDHSFSCSMTSLLMTSSFFCTSPWTLTDAPSPPALPSAPISAPLLTWLEMILMAVAREFSRLENSPETPGCLCSCSMV
jgi:hypothetical protein